MLLLDKKPVHMVIFLPIFQFLMDLIIILIIFLRNGEIPMMIVEYLLWEIKETFLKSLNTGPEIEFKNGVPSLHMWDPEFDS